MSNQSINLKQQLDALLSNPNTNSKQITVTRGRLIRQLQTDLKTTTNPLDIQNISTLLKLETNNQEIHLNTMLFNTKRNSRSRITQIPREFGLKIQKVANTINQLKMSQTKLEKFANSMNLAGNVISTGFSVAKIPISVALTITSAITPIVARLIVQPLQIPAYLLAKFINPNAPYNSRIITNIGGVLGDTLSNAMDTTDDFIRRI